MSGSWSTRANALTLLRLLCAPGVAFAIVRDVPLLSGVFFWLAVATDFADGWVARRYSEESALGGLVDHAVDATFVATGAAALAWLGLLPAALPPLIAVAFLQYALDSRWLAGRALHASALGRWNGIGYYVAIGIPLTRDALGLTWPPATLVQGVAWLFVVSTVVSISDRALRLRRALRNGVS